MNIGTIAFQTYQGIAYIAWDFYRHGIVNRVYTVNHSGYQSDPNRYPEKDRYNRRRLNEFVSGLDILLLIETGLDWDAVTAALKVGAKVVVIPMHEYSPFPFPCPVDLYLCPSLEDLKLYQGAGLKNCTFLPIPVNTQRFPWKLREKATRFIHNMGHGQYNYAKGTIELIKAMDLVSSPVKLTIRGQLEDAKVTHLFSQYRRHPRIEFVGGNVPENQLYDGDVFVYPEKWNGCSLPLQEAHASGMLVMASDRFPTNTWLPRSPLIPVQSLTKYRIHNGANLPFDMANVLPKVIAETIDWWYGKDISEYSSRGRDWADKNCWERLKPQYVTLLEMVASGNIYDGVDLKCRT